MVERQQQEEEGSLDTDDNWISEIKDSKTDKKKQLEQSW